MSMRLNYITILRVVTVILVVFGHSICMYTDKWRVLNTTSFPIWQNVADLIYAVHMPIFAIISGYLYMYIRKSGGYDDAKLFFLKKTTRLVIPFIVWGLFECFVDMNMNFRYLFTGALHLWFIRFLLEAFFITRLCDSVVLKDYRSGG